MSGRRSRGAATLLALMTGAVGAAPAGLAAQDAVAACEGLEGGLRGSCVESALALRAGRSAIGLAAAGGADLPGTNSTMGKRLGSMPRIGLALRGSVTRAPTADLDAGVPAGDGTAWLPAVRADAAVALFDGFSVAPTVGGILAVDVLGTVALVSASEKDGFTGGSLTGAGIGVRLGVFRESFTLPGVTLTATRRWMGETSVGGFDDGSAPGAAFETTVTSVRGVVGKDFFAVGVFGGGGWDRYEGEGRILASTPTAGAETVRADDLASDRAVLFGGLSWNFLVLQLALEAGWAGGFDDAPGRDGGFDPGRSSFFGAASFRLIL